METLNEKIEKRLFLREEEQLKLIENRKKHLLKEAELRKKLSGTPLDPNYEYELAEEWINHIKEGVDVAVQEELLKLEMAADNIYNTRDQREEVKNIKNGKQ